MRLIIFAILAALTIIFITLFLLWNYSQTKNVAPMIIWGVVFIGLVALFEYKKT